MKTVALVSALCISLTSMACSSSEAADEGTEDELRKKEAASTVVDAGDAAGTTMPGNLHWQRNAAEYQAITRQTYGLAATVLAAKVAQYKSEKPWAVVLDADETVLDNSQYQKESWQLGAGFSQERWTAWVQRKEAKAVPGAVGFLKEVHRLGGKVVIVTNRLLQGECPDTETTLRREGLEYDAIFCKADTSDKNPRFKAVAEGTAGAGLPALEVLLFVGDNIQDFPALDQTARTDEAKLAEFGSRFIALPNPMYGSWEKNPQN